MDQLPRSNDAYNNLFAESQPYHPYNSDFLNGNGSTLQTPSWGLNTSAYDPNQVVLQGANQSTTLPGPGNQFNVNRALSHSPAPFGQNTFGGYPPQQSFQPYSLPQYDPALFPSGYGTQPQNLGTIAPHALQQSRSPALVGNAYIGAGLPQSSVGQPRTSSASTPINVNQHALIGAIPKGIDNGYMSTINFDQLVRATSSERMGNYLSVGRDAQEWPVNRTTTVPQYAPRKSKNELRKLAGNDQSLLEKIGKKSLKKERAIGIPMIPRGSFVVSKDLDGPSESIKYEGESSSSEESDNDDSSYTSDDDLEGSPLPSKRPDSLKGGVEYDAIKALWRPKRKAISGDDIRKGIVDFWEVVKTIRDRWKTDGAAVTEAEEKNRQGELPLLKSRVKDQRDMIEVAFRAALKHGHRSIVELLGENNALVFLCYQFLLDRFKDDDLNSPLPRVILELMTLFTTLSGAILEKVHLDKVLPRYIKKGDAKTQSFAKRITANAAAVITTTETVTPQVNKAATSAKTGQAASLSMKRLDPEQVAGIKRPASNSGEGGAIKKAATMATKINGVATTAKPAGVVKRPAPVSAVTKPAANAIPVMKTKQVTAKPSSFFSSLQSATKKPGTSIKAGIPAQATGTILADRKVAPPVPAAPKAAFSFAETMAKLSMPKEEKPAATKLEKQLPLETAAEKARRLRKEARRKLHVSFKLGDELEQVRYFKHDPEEEIGHDDSQMRDVSDVGGEGRMLKLHAERMEVDEDDGEEAEQKLVDFKEPSPVDFSVIDDDERARNYVQCGGKLELESAERAIREQYEANTLIVFYTDEKDIPPNPREPANPYDGEPTSTMKEFGAPDEKFALRAKHRKATRPQIFHAPQQPHFDMSALGHFVGHQQPGIPAQQVPNLDIQKLLDSLGPSLQQQQPQAPLMGFPTLAQAPAPPMNQYLAPQPGTQPIDLSAILAAIGGQPTVPQMAGAFGAPPAMGYQPQMQQPSMGGQYDGGNESRSRHHAANSQYKTKVCKYWQEGKCAKGDACTYLHEEPGM
ncbi:hypothetical protein B0A54_13271 [Friedmanniomyces endolithicus]|uniref:C3H1-type domain-containing protein n=1 Tax=Friedmanniomyces endolithicus TaxID=329885 RepID=A0A4U0UL66_9PEZI|nr:hypothetical protein LTS09_013554 [Friedmanniomyces endolithicus]TKA36337.1 hypothetical protein B0A54_13271 [Friedmanniomyces endolithicus]